MRFGQIQSAFLCTLVLLVNPVRAGIIFDTFGPNDTYNASTLASIGTPDLTIAPYTQGVGFIATGSGFLSQLTLSLLSLQGSTEVDVWFMDDLNGKPGNILELFSLTNIPVLPMFYPYQDAPAPVTLNSTGSIPIYTGSRYWVIASAPDPESWVGWAWKLDSVPSSDVDRALRRPGDADWTVDDEGMAALRVTTVPIPSTLVLLVLAVTPLMRLMWRAKRSAFS